MIILNILCTKSLILNLFLFVKQAFSRPTVDFGPFDITSMESSSLRRILSCRQIQYET